MPRLSVLPALLLAWTVARAGPPQDATVETCRRDELAARRRSGRRPSPLRDGARTTRKA